jgi:tRNA-dihydrouridine synthase
VQNFWQNLQKPLLALAPMEDVTDTVFREIILSVSNPDLLSVLFTEFTSTDGLCHEKGRLKVMDRLVVSASELTLIKQYNTKLVAQIWGSKPENFYTSASMIADLGIFDGIDINMGCPVKKVVNNKSCSALINFPELAAEIIHATKEGSHLPVSVKTRLGFKSIITEKWIGHLLKSTPEAITIHGRTQNMMSEGQVLWSEIGKAVQLRNEAKSSTLIIGNGNVLEHSDALLKINEFGLDGIMIGRGVFRNPWVFNNTQPKATITQKLGLLQKHIELFDSIWQNSKNYNVLKRFYKIYLNDFRGAAECREKLMNTNSCREAIDIIRKFKLELLAIAPYQPNKELCI